MTDDFFDLVEQMRDAQKEYFRTRSKDALEHSKQLERSVDAKIRAYKEKKKQADDPWGDRQQKLDL